MIISSHDGGENESNIVLPVRASHALVAIRAALPRLNQKHAPLYIKLKAKASFTTGGNSIIFILQLLPVGWPYIASSSYITRSFAPAYKHSL